MISCIDAVRESRAEVRDGERSWNIVRAEELRGVEKRRDFVHSIPVLYSEELLKERVVVHAAGCRVVFGQKGTDQHDGLTMIG